MPWLSHIIQQGVAEGVFTTTYPDQAARIIIALRNDFGDAIIELLLSEDRELPDVPQIAQMVEATAEALERVLGSEAGLRAGRLARSTLTMAGLAHRARRKNRGFTHTLFALGVVGGEAGLHVHIDFVSALLAGLNLSGLAFFFGMVALLISQLTASRRAAAGWASGLLVLFLLLDMTGREVSGSWLPYLSPFYYYNLNRPLLPGFPDQPLAALLLLGLSVLCIVGSIVLFARRDIGRSAFESQRERASGTEPALRSLSRAERQVSTRAVSLHTLFADGWGSFWWLFGIVAFCAALLFVTPGFQKAFNQAVQQTPWL